MVWNTDPIVTVELVNLIGQAAQGLYSGEAYHESRRAHDHGHDDVQWMKTVPRRRSPHQAMFASDSYLRVMTVLVLRSS